MTDGRAWLAYQFDGEPLEPEHGGPARLLVPHPPPPPGYHNNGRPVEGAAL